MRHLIAALVMNEPGVLANVAGMFAARGFNIDSLVVGRTENPDISRMTIVITGDDQMLEQVRKQLSKLVEVVRVVDYSEVEYVERDLMLARVTAKPEDRRAVIEIADLFRARVVDVGMNELMIELSGTEEKLEAFVDLIWPHGVVELARTGVIAMPRSERREGAGNRISDLTAARRRVAQADKGNQPVDNVDPSKLPPG